MNGLDHGAIGGNTLGFEVCHLAAHHAARTGRDGDRSDQLERPRRVDPHPLRALGRHAEGLGEERVAGENGERFAVDDVHRRPPAPELVVVHRRQVVVHERLGVHELDGAGHRKGQTPGRGRKRLPPAPSA